MTKKERDLMAPKSKVPAFMGNCSNGRGSENVEVTDIIMPRVKLMQALSPEVEKGVAQVGTLINSLTGECFGSSCVFIPIKHAKSRIHWKSKDEGGGIICAAMDAKTPSNSDIAQNCINCKLKDWDNGAKVKKDKAPKCTLYYNFIVVLEGVADPIMLSMEKTKVPTARRLISLSTIKHNGKDLDMFAKKYKLSIKKDYKESNMYYNYEVDPVGFVTEAEFRNAEAIYNQFKDKNVKVEQDDPDDNFAESIYNQFIDKNVKVEQDDPEDNFQDDPEDN